MRGDSEENLSSVSCRLVVVRCKRHVDRQPAIAIERILLARSDLAQRSEKP